MPANKLTQAREGRFYGFRASSENWFLKQGLDETPPAVWVGQGTMGNSPTFPYFVTGGLYRGQMLVGDNFYGGIQRYFLERKLSQQTIDSLDQKAALSLAEQRRLEAEPQCDFDTFLEEYFAQT